MRRLLLSAAIVGIVWGGSMPATANPLSMSGFNNPYIEAVPVEQVGYRRRHWRYGYPVPYAYYPPAYGLLCVPRPHTPMLQHIAIMRLRRYTATLPRMTPMRLRLRMATMAIIRRRMATSQSRPRVGRDSSHPPSC
jgi:hypothetical protein